jgi:uncharacterized cupin superfamily protein
VSAPEARLEAEAGGLVPQGDGWFVVDARDARWWQTGSFGRSTTFEGEARFPDLGLNLNVLQPGETLGLYHGEDEVEGFLVLAGECTLLVEGQERALERWDFVRCPRWAEHVFVGAGDGPCVVLAVGTRTGGAVRYPRPELAVKYDAAAEQETEQPPEAYARFEQPVPRPYRAGDLPAW